MHSYTIIPVEIQDGDILELTSDRSRAGEPVLLLSCDEFTEFKEAMRESCIAPTVKATARQEFSTGIPHISWEGIPAGDWFLALDGRVAAGLKLEIRRRKSLVDGGSG